MENFCTNTEEIVSFFLYTARKFSHAYKLFKGNVHTKKSINVQRLPFNQYKRCANILLCCKSGRIGLNFLWRIGIIMHFYSCINSTIEKLFKQE